MMMKDRGVGCLLLFRRQISMFSHRQKSIQALSQSHLRQRRLLENSICFRMIRTNIDKKLIGFFRPSFFFIIQIKYVKY